MSIETKQNTGLSTARGILFYWWLVEDGSLVYSPQTGLERLPWRGEGGFQDGWESLLPARWSEPRQRLPTEGRRPSRGSGYESSSARAKACRARLSQVVPLTCASRHRGPASPFAVRGLSGWPEAAASCDDDVLWFTAVAGGGSLSVRGCCLWPVSSYPRWSAGASPLGRHGGAELGAEMPAGSSRQRGRVSRCWAVSAFTPLLALCCSSREAANSIMAELLQ